MDVSYSAAPVDVDRALLEAAAERPGEAIIVRLQPTLYRFKPGQRSGQQQAWTGVSWSARPKTVDEAIALREALRVFFATVATKGAQQVTDALTAL
jgi:hypothetical protein